MYRVRLCINIKLYIWVSYQYANLENFKNLKLNEPVTAGSNQLSA